MTDRPGWGILGPGGIAAAMTADLQLVGARVVAVGSRDAERAAAFAERFGIRTSHAGYEALVADPEVDIVYVATPQTRHAADALLAIEAGKHVLVEKPFAMNAAEARRIVDAAERRGVVALEAMWTRFLPHMARIRELIANGAIGELRSLVATHEQALAHLPGHRLLDPALGGGALLDLGVYPVSFAWDLFGAPSSTHALGTFTDSGVDARTSVLFGYPGGQHAVLHTAMDAKGGTRASILGSAGRIEIGEWWFAPTSATVFDTVGEVVEEIDGAVDGRGMQFQALELERLLAAGERSTPLLTPEASVGIMATLDDIRSRIGLRYPGE